MAHGGLVAVTNHLEVLVAAADGRRHQGNDRAGLRQVGAALVATVRSAAVSVGGIAVITLFADFEDSVAASRRDLDLAQGGAAVTVGHVAIFAGLRRG